MYKLSVVTPQQTLFDELAYSLTAPGDAGYLEILSHHAPLVTSLKEGKLVITDANKKSATYMISGGFLEVSKNSCIVLVDEAKTLA